MPHSNSPTRHDVDALVGAWRGAANLDSTPVPRWIRAVVAILGMLLTAIRFTALVMLTALEPLVRVACLLGMLLLIGTALLFGYAIDRPDFPFWGMLSAAAGCAVLLAAYHGLLRLLAR